MDLAAALQGKGPIVWIRLQHFRGKAGTVSVVDESGRRFEPNFTT